jgi:glycosyltransferase involved in cell wall biosynthesis
VIVLHFIAHLFPPAYGGLEMWTLRIAQTLARTGVRPIVHIRASRDEFDYGDSHAVGGIEIHPLARQRELLEEPLIRSGSSNLRAERWRLDFLLMCNDIAEEMRRTPNDRHVLISSFITAEGFLGSMVAAELGLPHIAVTVGTDYSRDYRNPRSRPAAEHVLRTAAAVVTMNEGQERAFRRDLKIANVRTIRPSVDERVMEYRWAGSRDGTIRLFSDTGFSFKKGTRVLLDAFARLRETSLPVTLTICGDNYEGQESYWNGIKREFREHFGDVVAFCDHAEVMEIWRMLVESDIYCSATFGEGSSLARSAALCIGVPVVTTQCGEMADLAEGASHVRLANPGDAEGFYEALRQACLDSASGAMQVDSNRVALWRADFAVSRECVQWNEVLADVLR